MTKVPETVDAEKAPALAALQDLKYELETPRGQSVKAEGIPTSGIVVLFHNIACEKAVWKFALLDQEVCIYSLASATFLTTGM